MIQRREKGASELNRAGEKRTDRQQRKGRIEHREHMRNMKLIE
jgi:hypothetical protein